MTEETESIVQTQSESLPLKNTIFSEDMAEFIICTIYYIIHIVEESGK